jgi:thiamine-phosphate pyrophosphorylase
MAAPTTRLYLLTPVLDDDPGAFLPTLAAACDAAEIAAVLARLAPADERTLIKRVKALAPAVQDRNAALVIAVEGEADLAMIAARGGADGVHLRADLARVRELRDRLKGERAIGVGGLRSKHDAMTVGEVGVDYLMFGEPRPDDSLPPLDAVVERAAWWAEIFETPCVAYAPTLAALAPLRATAAEFVALGDAVWSHAEGPTEALRLASAALRETEGVR